MKKNTMTLEGGEFIDAYNRTIKKDIAGTIYARVDVANQIFVVVRNETESEIVGGVGEKKSLNNTRWHLQDRIYDSDELATSVCTSFNPWYKVEEDGHKSNRKTKHQGMGRDQKGV